MQDGQMDTKALRYTLGGFPTGVCVITVPDPDHREGHVLGMTANSFTSVSLDPPLISWCLDSRAHRYAVYAGAETFGVNILSGGQSALSRRFAGGNAHVVPGEGLISPLHPLRFNDVIGFLSCELYEAREIGDHLQIIGRVRDFDRDTEVPGLTFFKGQYGQIGGAA